VKELLSQAGVPYVVKDVELDLESYRELLARGFRTVPVTLVGEDPGPTAIIGFNEEALRRALGLDAC
jgi:glutaredoxin